MLVILSFTLAKYAFVSTILNEVSSDKSTAPACPGTETNLMKLNPLDRTFSQNEMLRNGLMGL